MRTLKFKTQVYIFFLFPGSSAKGYRKELLKENTVDFYLYLIMKLIIFIYYGSDSQTFMCIIVTAYTDEALWLKWEILCNTLQPIESPPQFDIVVWPVSVAVATVCRLRGSDASIKTTLQCVNQNSRLVGHFLL